VNVPYDSIYRPNLFAEQTVLITGGGSGIGRCTAHELAHLGAHVALVGRSPDKLDAVRAEIQQDGGSVSTYVADIRDEARVVEVVDAVVADRGRVHGLVNNAGGQYRSRLEDITTKGFEAVVRNNLTGGFVVMREVFRRSMAEHGGAIVNMIADIWFGWPNYAHSGAARGGMLTLSETAATEWAENGVRVNTVAPGSIASSGLDTYDSADDTFLRRDVSAEIPLQRWGTEAEVAAAIVFLLSPGAQFITGSCMRIDGGAPNAGGAWWEPTPIRNHQPFNGFHRVVDPRVLGR
jgi:citronellol/citronellal dehydrogenase